ncbi:MAG: DNA primase [Lachnospiraceae bacterium]|nr:DNA primase [Lachnospiraceae bacterium]
MFYPDETVEEVREKNDIVDVISGYVALKKRGGNYFGLCPFHSEKSPSFSVSASKQMYYCFGCGRGGNVISFIMEYESLSFPEALKILAERAGITLPEAELSEEEKRRRGEKQRLYDAIKDAAYFYYRYLRSNEGKAGLEYFRKREISDETMRSFGLGYAGNKELWRYLKAKGYSDNEILTAGLAKADEKRGMSDRFWNRVMFPIMDAANRVIGFGGRVLGKGEPKYVNSPETPVFDKGRNLYGYNVARKTRKGYFIACEGYMDVISLHQAGFTEAVASLGTAFTENHALLLKRHTDDIRLTYDSDGPGINAALRAIPILRSAGINSKIIHLEPYKDPDEFIKALGAEAFRERVEEAENSFYFELDALKNNYNMKDPAERTKFEQETVKRLVRIENDIEREVYVKAVAERYMIDTMTLSQAVSVAAVKNSVFTPQKPVRIRETESDRKTKEEGIHRAEKMLLAMVAEDPEVFSQVKRFVRPEEFSEGEIRTAAEMLYSALSEGKKVSSILDGTGDMDEQRRLAEIYSFPHELPESNMEKEKALTDLIIRIKKNSVERSSDRETGMDPIARKVAEKQALEELRKIRVSLK